MQQVYNLDWFSGNESVKYPVDSISSFVPKGYSRIPDGLLGVITDISLSLPSSYATPYISALTITDDLITIIISSGTTPLLAFSSSQSKLRLNTYYDFEVFTSGCSGVITFGSGAKTVRGEFRFDSSDSQLLPATIHRYVSFPVTGLRRKGDATSCKGDITFESSSEVKVTLKEIKPRETRDVGPIGTFQALVFGLDTELGLEELQKYTGNCDVRPESNTCSRTSVERLGAVIPDCSGNITIRAENLNLDTSEGQITLSSDYTLEDVCPGNKMRELIGEDECESDEEESSTSTTTTSSNKINLYTSALPTSSTGIAFSSAGISNTTTGEESSFTLPDQNCTEMAFAFTTTGTIYIHIGGMTFTYSEGMPAVEGHAAYISNPPNTLRLIVKDSTWSVWNSSECLAEFTQEFNGFKNISVSLTDCSCTRVEYR